MAPMLIMADTNNNTHIDTLELDPANGQQCIVGLRDRFLELSTPAQTIEEVEDRLKKLFPQNGLIALAIHEANKQRNDTHKNHKNRHHSTSSSAYFTGALHNITSFAVAKVSNLVRDGVIGNKSENELSKYKIALTQFIIDDVLNLAGDFVKRQGNFIITSYDILTAMHADKDLLDIFPKDDKSLLITANHPILARINCTEKSTFLNNGERPVTYKQKVRSMVESENSFIRGLKLIIKVFKAQLERLPNVEQQVRIIFKHIEKLLELSTKMLTALEDALELVGQEDEIPYVGAEILDIAEAEEFYSYFKFANNRLSQQWKNAHDEITTNETTMTSIRTAGQSFDVAVRHLLPNYLLNTIIQFFEYYKNISYLYDYVKTNHSNPTDEEALRETLSILNNTKPAIETLLETKMNQKDIEPLDQKQAEIVRVILERRLDAELQHERNRPLTLPPLEIYRFSEPDTDNNIQFEDYQNRTISNRDLDKHLRQMTLHETDQIPVIKSATLIKLVERLTYHKYQPNIVDSFLTTYRSFISDPEELLDLLIERFRIPDPLFTDVLSNLQDDYDINDDDSRVFAYKQEIKRFRQEYSKPVKMRVINVLKSWIKNHYYDFERHPTLLDKLNQFLDEVYNTDKVLRSLIVSIKKSIEHKKKQKLLHQDDLELQQNFSAERPAVLWWAAKANESEKFDLLTLHPVEFARQLTIIEFDLFRAIKPSELINVKELGLSSRKEDKYESSPNLSLMTRHFTLLSYWVRKCIVETEDFDKRCAIYNRVIEIMGVLKSLNNFTGLLSIGSAIESAPISRLSHTKKSLTSTTIKVMEDYRELNDDHQKKLQRELKHCNPPCIPYLGSYQTKLIHAKEGNKTFIDDVDTSAISPTLSNDEFNSSFSNSPATPISPRTPIPSSRSGMNPPLSATSTAQNQFFGSCSTIQAPPKINFTKQRIRAGLVAEISNYQNLPYCLTVQLDIQAYIKSIEDQMVKFALRLESRRTQANLNGSLKQNIPALTKCLDDYLFEQSERIEPKNCTKPPKSKSKLPDHWKSPGIKIH